MRMLIPIGIVTITAVPLLALTAVESSEHQEKEVITRTIEIGDGERGFGFSIDASTSMTLDEDEMPEDMSRMLSELMKSGGGMHRVNIGDHGEMVIAVSMQDDHDRPRNSGQHDNQGNNRDNPRNNHDHDDGDHDRGDRDRGDHDRGDDRGRVIELDLGELTNGQVSGHIVIDLNDMMARGMGRNDGEVHHEVDIEMIVEDENGRRHIVRRSNDDAHGDRRMSPRRGPNGGPMDGAMMFRSDDPGMMPPGGAMGMTGMHGGPMEGMFVFGPNSPMDMRGMDEHDMRSMMGNRMAWIEDRGHEGDREEEMHHMHEMLDHLHGMMEHQAHMLEDGDLDEDEMEQMRDMVMEWRHRMDDREHHEEDHHDDDGHDGDDEFFHQAESFIEKIHMTRQMAGSLSDREALAIFGIWQAREHMHPEQRVEMLSPMINDEGLMASVRNAATWVVMESLADMGKEGDAQSTLADLIRRNGSIGN